jgi:thioesterase domain-containing protein/glutathione synthase/RimK-type ligase-like ATP-grasp enzyme
MFAGAGGDTDELRLVAAGLTGDPHVVALALRAEPGSGDTIESMALRCLEAIRAEQPEGPYHLLGYSLGGLVALEVSRLLQERGDTVGLVGMVDSFFDQRYWPTRLFVKASARRAALHLRQLRGQPAGAAVHQLTHRSVRLARRVNARRRRADVAAGGAGTVQDDNIAVMARWRPSVFPFPVTLFTGSTSVVGCPLADLWQPWLPALAVRDVRGDHVDLTQTAAGAKGLAQAVGDALTTPPLRVLVASTFGWPGVARLAIALDEVGCHVEAAAPRGSAVHAIAAVRRSHPMALVAPVRSLGRAILSSQPDIVVAFDDRTRHALTLLHTRSDPRTEAGAALREALERSLGSPSAFSRVYSRATFMQVAHDAGIVCPPTASVRTERDVSAWFMAHPGRAVLKTDGSWGGRGVVVVRDEAEARRAWQALRRPGVARILKRLVVERDPWPLRERLASVPPTVSIQCYVDGRPANAAITCLQGTVLGSVQAEVVASAGVTGPSTVIKVLDHPDMTFAAKSVVNTLGLSGLCGLDFILDDEGRAHLIELNPRATPTSHLVAADGTDPLTALRIALGHQLPPVRTATYPDGMVALFPQELHRDPTSPYLRSAHHDVPGHAPDFVAQALARRRGPGRWVDSIVTLRAHEPGRA